MIHFFPVAVDSATGRVYCRLFAQQSAAGIEPERHLVEKGMVSGLQLGNQSDR